METGFIKIGGRLISTESEEGKEYLKWERKPNYNPDAPENRYPRMLYMAQRRPDGVVSVGEPDDHAFSNVTGAGEQFNRRCQLIVRGEQEETAALERGWRRSATEALERFESKEKHIADAAAHRSYEDRNMGEKAKAEVAAAEAETVEHVAEVPEKRRVGRPRKVA